MWGDLVTAQHITHAQLLAALDVLGLPHDVLEVHLGGVEPTDDAWAHSDHLGWWRARTVRYVSDAESGCRGVAHRVFRYEVSYHPIRLGPEKLEEPE